MSAEVTPSPAFAWGHVGFAGVLKAEWIKLWTLRSTWWVLGVMVLVTIGLGAMIAVGLRVMVDTPAVAPGQVPAFVTIRATDAAMAMVFGQLVMSILAVLVVTGEYSSGQVRSTLAAVPARWPVLVAKALVIAVVAFAATFVALYATVLVCWPLIAPVATDDRFLRSGVVLIAGMALATALVCVFALAVGAIVRSTAGAIGIVLGLLFVLPIITAVAPWGWVATVRPYLIDTAQVGLYQPSEAGLTTTPGAFGFVKALWVMGLWALVPLLGAGVLLKRRDA